MVSRVNNESEFTLTFHSFNGAESHAFDLRKGDGIRVEIDCEEGALSVTIQKDGEEHSKGSAAFCVIANPKKGDMYENNTCSTGGYLQKNKV